MTAPAQRPGKLKFIGAVQDEWPVYSDSAPDYTLGPPIGFGASSTVYAATWKPVGEHDAKPLPCAVKVLDLDQLPPQALHLLRRETTLMSLSKHPNVLRVRGSWIDGHRLCIALRLMNAGSAADVMRYAWPGGMEEEVVKCILKQALEGLNYLHINGFIHRDIKAANMLIDDDGTVLLGDLGVAADLHDEGAGRDTENHHRKTAIFEPMASARSPSSLPPATRPPMMKRKSFVGTPCWMAPEVINGKQYDSSADIWSFGITAIELTQGRPPRSRESSHKVLLQTVQDAAPIFSRTGGDGRMAYSRAFADMVASCLNKDPTARPTAEELLASPFFKNTKKNSFLVNSILKDLPPLSRRQERVKTDRHRTHASIDSWDFATTLASHPGSPTATHFRRPHSLLIVEETAPRRSGSKNGPRSGACTPLSEQSAHHAHEVSAGSSHSGATRSTRSHRVFAGSRAHSRNASWVEGEHGESLIFPVDETAHEIVEAEDELTREVQPQDEEVTEPTLNSPQSSPPRSSTLNIPHLSDPHPPALAVPGLSCSASSASSGPSPLTTPKSPPTRMLSRSPGDLVPSAVLVSASPTRLTSVKPPQTGRTASSPGFSPVSTPTTATPSLWRKLRGKASEERRQSNSSDKEKRKSGFMGTLLSRTVSGGAGTRGKLERAYSERG